MLTDGGCFDIDGTVFTVCPWWDGPRAREQVAWMLARDAGQPKRRWVWVYHSPTSWVGKRHIGDGELNAWIAEYAPDLVLTGHIHQSPFVKDGSWVDRLNDTWVFNPGRQIGPSPTRILFDEARSTALRLSLAGAEEVRLDQPMQGPPATPMDVPGWLI